MRLAPDPIATWSRFSFAPSGFGQFVEARAIKAGTAKAERIRREKELIQKTATVAVYLPTQYNPEENLLRSKSSFRKRKNKRISVPQSSSRARVDRSLGHRRSSNKFGAATKVARAALRRLRPSAPSVTTGRDGKRRFSGQSRAAPVHVGKRRLSRSRVYAGARRTPVTTARRGQRKVYSLLMDTPAWARKAFTSD